MSPTQIELLARIDGHGLVFVREGQILHRGVDGLRCDGAELGPQDGETNIECALLDST